MEPYMADVRPFRIASKKAGTYKVTSGVSRALRLALLEQDEHVGTTAIQRTVQPLIV